MKKFLFFFQKNFIPFNSYLSKMTILNIFYLKDLLQQYQFSTPLRKEEILTHLSFNPSFLKNLISASSTPFTLEDVKILTQFNYLFHSRIQLTDEALLFLLQNYPPEKMDFLRIFQTLEQFKLLLLYNCLNLQQKYQNVSLYYHVQFLNSALEKEKIIQYLYQEGLSLSENFTDLLPNENLAYLYPILNISDITKDNFEAYFLNFFSGYSSQPFQAVDDFNFLKKILIFHDYFELDYLSQFESIYSHTQDEFYPNYVRQHLTAADFLDYLESHVNEDTANNLLSLAGFYGFDNLEEKVHEIFVDEILEMDAEDIGYFLNTAQKLKYPYLKEIIEIIENKISDYLEGEGINFLKGEGGEYYLKVIKNIEEKIEEKGGNFKNLKYIRKYMEVCRGFV